nr:uncharacterized protein LOC119163305 [Rhipicephalus microplus]
MAHTIKVRMKVRWIRGRPSVKRSTRYRKMRHRWPLRCWRRTVLCSMRIMTTMGSDSDGASSLCSRTLTSPQPAIPGDRSERQRDLQDIDDGGDYSGDCAATVYDPCGANHFISDDDNTDFGSCDDTTDPTTMGTQHDTVDSVTRGVFLSECNSEVCDVADGIDSEGPFNGNLSTDADTNRTQLGDLFQEVLNEKIVVSKGEMLLMIFKHAIKSNLSFTAMVSLIEMVNMFFERPVLPHSRYQLGKLFSEHGTEMSFHFICGKCSTVHEVAQSYAQSSHCQKCGWALASSVNSESFFVLLDVPSQLRKVLKNCSFLDLTKPLSQSSNLSDICDGELYRKFVSATVDEGHRISFTLNADGTPLFSSSNTSIWPIQLYTSHNYSSKKKTNSSVVRLADQSYAVIETILMKQGEVYIAARRLHCSAVKYSTLVMEHLVKVQREAATTTLVSASEIFSVCAHMQVGPNIFISPVPSSFTM